jgi:hypothetical protein
MTKIFIEYDKDTGEKVYANPIKRVSERYKTKYCSKCGQKMRFKNWVERGWVAWFTYGAIQKAEWVCPNHVFWMDGHSRETWNDLPIPNGD